MWRIQLSPLEGVFDSLFPPPLCPLAWVLSSQSTVLESIGCVQFNRTESKDRLVVREKLRQHVSHPDRPPLLIFPEGSEARAASLSPTGPSLAPRFPLSAFLFFHEHPPRFHARAPQGTCVNNEYCVMFKRGAFELGATVCPIAVCGRSEANSAGQLALECALLPLVRTFWVCQPPKDSDLSLTPPRADKIQQNLRRCLLEVLGHVLLDAHPAADDVVGGCGRRVVSPSGGTLAGRYRVYLDPAISLSRVAVDSVASISFPATFSRIRYLEPQNILPGESPDAFASRVQVWVC